MVLDRFVTFFGCEVYYRIFGESNNEVVVLLHGFLEASFVWEVYVDNLSQKHRVVCIDLLGHGQSGCVGEIHRMELMAEAVKLILDREAINQIALIGHSMGGYVGLALADLHPGLVKNLMLLNSTPFEDSVDRLVLRDRSIKAVKENLPLAVELSVGNLFYDKNRLIFEDKIVHLKQKAVKTSLQGIVAALEGMKIRPNRVKILEQTSLVVYIVLGIHDPIINVDDLTVFKGYKNIEIRVLSGGHMSWMEDELGLKKVMSTFLRSN